MEWNAIATVREGHGHEKALLRGLKHLGEFHPSNFKYVCYGRVADLTALLDAVLAEQAANAEWTQYLARLIPIEHRFHFEADTFISQLKQAVDPFAQRLGSGTFFVRVERRGMLGRVDSREAERETADHLIGLLEARGKQLGTDFSDPDWIVACETLGAEAGVCLIDRALRRRYPFVQVH